MTPRFNFAPVSSAQSGLLRFSSAYLILNGLLNGLLVAVTVVGLLLGHKPPAPTMLVVLGIVLGTAMAVGLVWTGSLLGRGTRFGGFLALGFVLIPFAFAALRREAMDGTVLVSSVLGLLVLLIVWHELK